MSCAIDQAQGQDNPQSRSGEGDQMNRTGTAVPGCERQTEGHLHFAGWWSEYEKKMSERFQIGSLKLRAQAL